VAFKGLLIGIDRYASTEINWLSCASRDAIALHALFTDTLARVCASLREDAVESCTREHFVMHGADCHPNDPRRQQLSKLMKASRPPQTSRFPAYVLKEPAHRPCRSLNCCKDRTLNRYCCLWLPRCLVTSDRSKRYGGSVWESKSRNHYLSPTVSAAQASPKNGLVPSGTSSYRPAGYGFNKRHNTIAEPRPATATAKPRTFVLTGVS
jgi:hypothetical protein